MDGLYFRVYYTEGENMGSWNETCFLSNLAIYGGDPVVGFLVAIHHYGDQNPYLGSVYSTDAGSPFGLPFDGKYDDYGSIRDYDEDSIAVRCNKNILSVDNFGECLSQIERSVVSSRDGIVEVSLKRFADIELDENYKTHIKTCHPVPVTLVMAHKDIVDALVEEDGVDISKKKSDIRSKLDAFSGKHGRVFATHNLGFGNITENDDYVTLIDFALEQPEEQLDKFLEALVIEQTIKRVMMKLRKVWMGTTGKGSQTSFRRTHLTLAEAVKTHIYNSFSDHEEAYGVLLNGDDW
jgi:hypothetical protein